MDNTNQKFCFATLALGKKYREMTKTLAEDLKKYSSGTMLVVGTDNPKDLLSFDNVIPFKLSQQGILHCYHDKRFVILKALSEFDTVIQIDADTYMTDFISPKLDFSRGIIEGFNENLVNHVTKYTPERLDRLKKIATKIDVDISQANFVGESLFIVSKDNGKEIEFIEQWGKIGLYLELKGIHAGSGNIIGLAALKVGFKTSRTPSWEQIKNVTNHFDASQKIKRSSFDNLKRRVQYHYRLNKNRLQALSDFDFFYR
ncbi:hypothetical protein Cyast_0441 [Cyanobacterium stanieri PCC 7202]|uniref:Glycosyl transferase family 8 n=1 Tax=Cyanobacterium stanieri (strain ATCC 29140 / PCC 7202) TaxID=292563 RepID=K9YHH7_CYASC|nr:hypothetical protein Cyast_0441 [Cyanobacterium stanieri PCC 7202]